MINTNNKENMAITGDHLDSFANIDTPPSHDDIHAFEDLKSVMPADPMPKIKRAVTISFMATLVYFFTSTTLPFFKKHVPKLFNSNQSLFYESILFFITMCATMLALILVSNFKSTHTPHTHHHTH